MKAARTELSEHEKQFAYLPLNLLDGATNIRGLLLDSVLKGKEWHLDNVIDQIHQQMAQTCGRWLPELANLRFVEMIDDTDVPNVSKTTSTTSISTAQHQKCNDKFCWECHDTKHIAWSCSTCIRSFHDTAESSKSRNLTVMTLWQCSQCIAIEKDLQQTEAKYEFSTIFSVSTDFCKIPSHK